MKQQGSLPLPDSFHGQDSRMAIKKPWPEDQGFCVLNPV